MCSGPSKTSSLSLSSSSCAPATSPFYWAMACRARIKAKRGSQRGLQRGNVQLLATGKFGPANDMDINNNACVCHIQLESAWASIACALATTVAAAIWCAYTWRMRNQRDKTSHIHLQPHTIPFPPASTPSLHLIEYFDIYFIENFLIYEWNEQIQFSLFSILISGAIVEINQNVQRATSKCSICHSSWHRKWIKWINESQPSSIL